MNRNVPSIDELMDRLRNQRPFKRDLLELLHSMMLTGIGAIDSVETGAKLSRLLGKLSLSYAEYAPLAHAMRMLAEEEVGLPRSQQHWSLLLQYLPAPIAEVEVIGEAEAVDGPTDPKGSASFLMFSSPEQDHPREMYEPLATKLMLIEGGVPPQLDEFIRVVADCIDADGHIEAGPVIRALQDSMNYFNFQYLRMLRDTLRNGSRSPQYRDEYRAIYRWINGIVRRHEKKLANEEFRRDLEQITPGAES